MRKIITKVLLLAFCLYSGFFFIGSTLAPILAHFQVYELSAKLTAIYMFSCHQDPSRSFWLLGYPIALCCRCYGTYLGSVIFSIFALCDKLKINLKIYVILLLICLVDIFINYGMGIRAHNTGNIIRFIIGIIMGLLITTTINYILTTEREN